MRSPKLGATRAVQLSWAAVGTLAIRYAAFLFPRTEILGLTRVQRVMWPATEVPGSGMHFILHNSLLSQLRSRGDVLVVKLVYKVSKPATFVWKEVTTNEDA